MLTLQEVSFNKVKAKEDMKVTIEHPDKTTQVHEFIDKLFLYYAAKWLNQDQKPLYKSSLTSIYSLLGADEIDFILQKVLRDFTYIPKIHDLSKLANYYIKRHVKPSDSIQKASSVPINKYNYSENDFNKSVDFVTSTLEMFYTKASVKCFIGVHDMMFKGFIKSDLDFFADKTVSSNRVLKSYDIIKMFIYIRRSFVNPRIDKLRGRESIPQDMTPLDRQKYARMNKMLLSKSAPQLELK